MLEYKIYKNAAAWLNFRQENGLRAYYRVSAPPVVIEHLDLSELGVYDLIDILMDAYFSHEHETPMSDVVTITALTIRNRINEIKSFMQMNPKVSFSKLVENDGSRLDIVVTFLSLLELIKNYAIIAAQESPFSDITFKTTRDLGLEFEPEL